MLGFTMLAPTIESLLVAMLLFSIAFLMGWLNKKWHWQKHINTSHIPLTEHASAIEQLQSQVTALSPLQTENYEKSLENQKLSTLLETEKKHYNSLIDQYKDRVQSLEDNNRQTQQKIEQTHAQLILIEKSAGQLTVERDQFQLRLKESQTQTDALLISKTALEDQFHELKQKHTELLSQQKEREKSFQHQLAQFEQQKQALTEQFKVLANDILESKTQQLHQHSQHQLKSVLSPFQQTLDGFKKEVQEIHHRESRQQGELKKELESLKSLNQQMTNEAHQLSTALRGQKKLQGNWGELILENILERSGLEAGKDFRREVSFNTEEGKKRPDAIVYLPQNKHLVIDAKVSLNAYTRYVNSLDDVSREQALKEHTHAIKQRINELAARDYEKLPGLNSPEMVFMFIPIESAFVEALKADESLFQQAIENHVLVATPTTLLTSLNIVRQLWRYEDQNKHTALLLRKAESVFKKLNAFLASFEGMKKGLDKALDAYQKAEGQLISGKGNLVKQVAEFKKLSPGIKGELPSYFTEKAELEADLIGQSTDTPESS